MGNKKTPLIKTLRQTKSGYNSGGTLYVFPSASEDIGLNLNSTVNGVALSHYALLNIPDMSLINLLGDTTKDPLSNKSGIFGGCLLSISDTNGENTIKDNTEGFAKALAMSLLNYMMNFETLLVNLDNYNYQDQKTVTEKVFWHWARKVGIIKESEGGTNGFKTVEGYDNIYYDTNFNKDSSTLLTDNTVIKCFGKIDAGNSLSTEFGMFNETYINIPTSYGAGPVFLKASEDRNYKYLSYSIADKTSLEGRSNDIEQMSYLGYDKPYYDNATTATTARYITNQTPFDGLEIVKDLPLIEKLIRKQTNDDSISITSYDDVNVDINQKIGADLNYEFNAILLYYSTYDLKDIHKTAYATNLFGIIFLDGPALNKLDSGNLYYIPRHTKTKSTSDRFGNSYSFRVNIKTMSVYDNTDAIIQDNTTMSSIASADFSDAISLLNKACDIMNSNLLATINILNQYAAIKSYYTAQEEEIETLQTQFEAYIKGERTAIIDTSLLYANTYRPNAKNIDNSMSFVIRDGEDEFGNTLYSEPVMSINEEGVNISRCTIFNEYTQNLYVLVDNNNTDNVNVTDQEGDCVHYDDVLFAQNVLNKMFNGDSQLNIKIKYDYDYSVNNAIHHEKIYNLLYIDPDSPIFNQNKEDNVGYIKLLVGDSSVYINYVGLIPFIIAYMLKMNTDMPYNYSATNSINNVSDIHSVLDALTYLINKIQ